ncbi:hypothetical protein [uncultured Paraglaciecola sp.]|uniref:hypothetical protein n=1 Tax=uncultured Paraglaciecola sp. TaxID=1765024 RepID=UPI002629349D|nr:hypothetical protein [uncultured Paraglaciecola sp.]
MDTSTSHTANIENNASLATGYNFEFSHDGKIIRAVGSALSGKEQVFCNDQLVASKRSLGIKSRLPFELDNNQYEVEFKATNFFTGEIQCSLLKGGALIESQKQTIDKKYQVTGKTKTLFIVSQVAFVGLLMYWAIK